MSWTRRNAFGLLGSATAAPLLGATKAEAGQAP